MSTRTNPVTVSEILEYLRVLRDVKQSTLQSFNEKTLKSLVHNYKGQLSAIESIIAVIEYSTEYRGTND